MTSTAIIQAPVQQLTQPEAQRVPADAEQTEGPAPASRWAGAGRYLTFTLAGEVYALDILKVTEIIEFRSVTTVPMMPPFIRGVINLRGRVLPVVDLIARFGQGATAIARRTSIVVVHTAGRGAEESTGAQAVGNGVGIMVDAVNKVVHLGDEDVQPPPAFGAGIRSDFICGMAKYEGEFVIVLDIDKILPLDEISAMAQDGAATLQAATLPANPSGQPALAAPGRAAGS